MSDPVSSFDLTLEQLAGYEFKVGWDKPWAELKTDEPPPLGKDAGPGPSRMLAVAIANCLASSLLFCLSRKGEKVEGLTARVHVEIVRNAERRLRVGKVDVTLKAPLERDSKALLECIDTFEDFCTITESVRAGVQVNVNVEAVG
ncbi:MAG: OsmC family protein [Archangium sp.]|nr:OsmC family protein [Archangium sp.]